MRAALADEMFTLADALRRLGDIKPCRIRMRPWPGTATDRHLISQKRLPGRRVAELIDGILVDKAMGLPEGGFTVPLLVALALFIKPRKLGLLATNDDYMRLAPGIVRVPDISFTLRKRVKPDWQKMQIADFAPDLAIEFISPGNTAAEMARKRREYFAAGTQLVWEINNRKRVIDVYTSPKDYTRLTMKQTLTGEPVLPGFKIPVAEVFADPMG